MDFVLLWFGIELLFLGCEDDVAPDLRQQLAVMFERPRICVEIFVRRKLESIDEDARFIDILNSIVRL